MKTYSVLDNGIARYRRITPSFKELIDTGHRKVVRLYLCSLVKVGD